MWELSTKYCSQLTSQYVRSRCVAFPMRATSPVCPVGTCHCHDVVSTVTDIVELPTSARNLILHTYVAILSWWNLHILLNQMAALVLISFTSVFVHINTSCLFGVYKLHIRTRLAVLQCAIHDQTLSHHNDSHVA